MRIVKQGRNQAKKLSWWIYRQYDFYLVDIVTHGRSIGLTAKTLEQAEAIVKEYIDA